MTSNQITNLINDCILLNHPDSALPGLIVDLDGLWATADERLKGRLTRAYAWLAMSTPDQKPTRTEDRLSIQLGKCVRQ